MSCELNWIEEEDLDEECDDASKDLEMSAKNPRKPRSESNETNTERGQMPIRMKRSIFVLKHDHAMMSGDTLELRNSQNNLFQ